MSRQAGRRTISGVERSPSPGTSRRVTTEEEARWWQDGVVYQIYPRSFADSNGDGIGDLAGIISRLDYVVELGVDAVWISPIYPSPMADFGYDVADYCGVDPMFGTLADADRLIAEAHARGLRLILDFVPNHSSDQHPWFLAGRASRDDPKRDWYIWRDAAAGGGAPNNWLSHFGGSAWEWDAPTGQYYLHSFLREQPDLNWRNPAVRAAMYDALRFWLDRGVDGFRIDVMWLLIKDDQFRSNPPNPGWAPGRGSYERLLPLYTADRPEVHAIVAELRALLDKYGARVLIGEIYLPVERLMTYYGHDLKGAHLPFNFQLIDAPWNAAALAGIIRDYEAALPVGAWPNWVLGNHDKPRIASRVGSPQARVAAMLLLTLRGTPTVYYGDELGMVDVPIPADRVTDPAEKNQPGIGIGRDPERTPMPWEASPGGGFTTGEPWLPLGDHAQLNVAAEAAHADSILQLHRRLLELRRAHPALTRGALVDVRAHEDVLMYERREAGRCLTVVLNLGHEARTVPIHAARIVLSTFLDRTGEAVAGTLALRAAEGVILAGADTAV
jgi:alpha-glucosidase